MIYVKMNEKKEDTKFEFLIKEAQRRKKRKELLLLLEEDKRGNKPIRFFKTKWIKYAAAVCLLFFMWTGANLLLSDSAPQLAMNFIDETSTSSLNEMNHRSGEKKVNNKTFEMANNALVDGNYHEAAVLYQSLAQKQDLNNREKLNYAMAVLKQEKSDYSKAILLLQSLKEASSGIEIEQLWLLGLSYTLTGQDKKAIDCFQQLQSNSHYKSKEIKKILSKIN